MGRTSVLRNGGEEYAVTVDEGQVVVNGGDPVRAVAGDDGMAEIGDRPRRRAWIRAAGDTRWVFLDGRVYVFDVVRPGAGRKASGHHGTLSAPMPATVIRVETAIGAHVSRGDVLIVLEAMKMELPVRAPADGVVTAINCQAGELVQPGVGLIEIEES